MRKCLFAVALACVPLIAADNRIRSIYVTGDKQNAVHAARKYLDRWTCMNEVDDPAQADAIVDLEDGTVRPVALPPPTPQSGFVSCWSGSRSATCQDGQWTSATSCSGTGGDIRCDSYTYDSTIVPNALFLGAAQLHHSIMSKITSKAYLLSRDSKTLLWEYDEGVKHEKNGVSPEWWSQLNNYVGCGKSRHNYKKQGSD
jgi:hypothetical protein